MKAHWKNRISNSQRSNPMTKGRQAATPHSQVLDETLIPPTTGVEFLRENSKYQERRMTFAHKTSGPIATLAAIFVLADQVAAVIQAGL